MKKRSYDENQAILNHRLEVRRLYLESNRAPLEAHRCEARALARRASA